MMPHNEGASTRNVAHGGKSCSPLFLKDLSDPLPENNRQTATAMMALFREPPATLRLLRQESTVCGSLSTHSVSSSSMTLPNNVGMLRLLAHASFSL